MKKSTSTKDFRKLKSKHMKELWNDPVYRSMQIRKKNSIATRRKSRVAAIKRISKQEFNGNPIVPSFNPNACKIIDEYGKKHGYHFQHAMNGGEFYIKDLGYWVDGYDKEKNVVIEIDEAHHRSQKKEDMNRKREIENYLECKFIRMTI